MKRRVTYILFPFILMLGMALGCKPSNEPVKVEIVDSFKQLINNGINTIETDLEAIDKDLYETNAKLLKLEGVVTPALAWAEDQKVQIEEHVSGSWIRQVPREWLSETLKNDQYEVTMVVLSALDMGSPGKVITLEIEVLDLTTKTKQDWESIDKQLKMKISNLEHKRQAVIESGKLSLTTFQNVIEQYEAWEINRIDQNTYSISGPGLGIPDTGRWTYYKETAEIVPADDESKALKKVLSGES